MFKSDARDDHWQIQCKISSVHWHIQSIHIQKLNGIIRTAKEVIHSKTKTKRKKDSRYERSISEYLQSIWVHDLSTMLLALRLQTVRWICSQYQMHDHSCVCLAAFENCRCPNSTIRSKWVNFDRNMRAMAHNFVEIKLYFYIYRQHSKRKWSHQCSTSIELSIIRMEIGKSTSFRHMPHFAIIQPRNIKYMEWIIMLQLVGTNVMTHTLKVTTIHLTYVPNWFRKKKLIWNDSNL